jgi:hypothetical protein
MNDEFKNLNPQNIQEVSVDTLVKQLEFCHYDIDGLHPLEMNIAYVELVERAKYNDTLRDGLAAANQRAEKAEAICNVINKYKILNQPLYCQPLDWEMLNDLFDAWHETKGEE